MLRMGVRPHIEQGGYHLDLFEASLDDWLILVSPQPLYDGARALLACGYDPDTLLTLRYDGEDHDSSEPKSIRELANGPSEQGAGLRRPRWKRHETSRSRT
jgi:hypothetical protein